MGSSDPGPVPDDPGYKVTNRRTMIVGVSLVVLVTVAAGIGGTAHFTRARWLPHHFPPKRTTGGAYIPGDGGSAGQSGGFGLPIWLVVIGGVIVVGAFAVLSVFAWRRGRDRGLAFASEAESSLHGSAQGVSLGAAEVGLESEAERLLTGVELALAELDRGA